MPEEKQKTPADEAKDSEALKRQQPHFHKPDPKDDQDDELFNDMPV
ncbi:hypothetical protein [Nioella nitratireducens]|nr:hypothetical protein [Nioella nitratireducens]